MYATLTQHYDLFVATLMDAKRLNADVLDKLRHDLEHLSTEIEHPQDGAFMALMHPTAEYHRIKAELEGNAGLVDVLETLRRVSEGLKAFDDANSMPSRCLESAEALRVLVRHVEQLEVGSEVAIVGEVKKAVEERRRVLMSKVEKRFDGLFAFQRGELRVVRGEMSVKGMSSSACGSVTQPRSHRGGCGRN